MIYIIWWLLLSLIIFDLVVLIIACVLLNIRTVGLGMHIIVVYIYMCVYIIKRDGYIDAT